MIFDAQFVQSLTNRLGDQIDNCIEAVEQVTLEVPAHNLLDVCRLLRDDAEWLFSQLIDVCGVDYLHYGQTQWATHDTTSTGFSRGVSIDEAVQSQWPGERFAVIYHLLSIKHNRRLRLRTYGKGEPPIVPSVINIWPSADWFEREAFDLYGILFEGHPDLRRILTDYGFVGHPFRKDFPVSGHVEMRYDPEQKRVIYEPVTIEPRTLVPKVIRSDDRYASVAASEVEGETHG